MVYYSSASSKCTADEQKNYKEKTYTTKEGNKNNLETLMTNNWQYSKK